MKKILVLLGVSAGGTALFFYLKHEQKKKLVTLLSKDLSDVEKQGKGQAALEKMSIPELKEYQKAISAKKESLSREIKAGIDTNLSLLPLVPFLSQMTAQEMVDVSTRVKQMNTGEIEMNDPVFAARMAKIGSKYKINTT